MLGAGVNEAYDSLVPIKRYSDRRLIEGGHGWDGTYSFGRGGARKRSGQTLRAGRSTLVDACCYPPRNVP